MPHLSENTKRLNVLDGKSIPTNKPCIEFIVLPYYKNIKETEEKIKLQHEINQFIQLSHPDSVIVILSSPIFMSELGITLTSEAHIKLWVAVKLSDEDEDQDLKQLRQQHSALLILTKNKKSLKHTKTRIGYSYCPYCEKTTKDYGGKKHLYHEYGTLMSDIWRDIEINQNHDPEIITNRLQDLFGIPDYDEIFIHDWRNLFYIENKTKPYREVINKIDNPLQKSILINEDCLSALKKIPNNSIEFCFADPPYNLNKKYENWDDGIDIQKYFEWCDEWLAELARVLKPGGTLAVLNIPQWCIRHFKYLNSVLDFQDWIVWEGLSLPVRMIMPAHYAILCFSKGHPRPLPGLNRSNASILEKLSIHTLKEGYCSRSSCITERRKLGIQDDEIISNLWWNIHRLKHNSRRVDHPCQLPPQFMHRLISMFTNEGEWVLDPFNGAGTTSLAAQQLNRNYIGIELSEYYHQIATERHQEIALGLDPFRKTDHTPKTKNNYVKRIQKQTYDISKKTLQLEVKEIAQKLGRKPTKKDIEELSQYPLEYYESYFISWGEVTAAARTTGMSERKTTEYKSPEQIQLRLFEAQPFFED